MIINYLSAIFKPTLPIQNFYISNIWMFVTSIFCISLYYKS